MNDKSALTLGMVSLTLIGFHYDSGWAFFGAVLLLMSLLEN